jgi:hypothetical protein
LIDVVAKALLKERLKLSQVDVRADAHSACACDRAAYAAERAWPVRNRAGSEAPTSSEQSKKGGPPGKQATVIGSCHSDAPAPAIFEDSQQHKGNHRFAVLSTISIAIR